MYLCITLGDNDFTSYFGVLGESLQRIICWYKNEFSESLSDEQLEKLRPYVARIWWSTHNMQTALYSSDIQETAYDVFERNLELSVVDYADIPEWNDCEDIYIPLFDNELEVLCR